MSRAMLTRMLLARSEIIDGTKIRQFRTENAKSDRSKCQICLDKIDQDEVRISRLDEDRGIDRWHHVHCFIVAAPDLDFHTSVENLQGFYRLSAMDQWELIDAMEHRHECFEDPFDSEYVNDTPVIVQESPETEADYNQRIVVFDDERPAQVVYEPVQPQLERKIIFHDDGRPPQVVYEPVQPQPERRIIFHDDGRPPQVVYEPVQPPHNY
eukprot:TRINITY_DN3552_c0_g1_i1.p1 TRINITY_DN3552_c0_g1~~TRINITY_DN3552_c0_g1_i1.p1  ORF type:complete len:211 (+),score=25.19 TRINITY_DN3552_c0_g1_i1:106-738(+)